MIYQVVDLVLTSGPSVVVRSNKDPSLYVDVDEVRLSECRIFVFFLINYHLPYEDGYLGGIYTLSCHDFPLVRRVSSNRFFP